MLKELNQKSVDIRRRWTSPKKEVIKSIIDKARRNNLKLITLLVILITVSGCSEFAILASGSSLAVSQNAYVKVYNGVDVLTVISTEKSIKKHVYENIKSTISH